MNWIKANPMPLVVGLIALAVYVCLRVLAHVCTCGGAHCR